ncbi:long-chain fatty acid--CoA ligase [Azospirillum sp. TSO22-1]|uniref:long-chain-fatty-acid--CoA ligase n=1 Tax=Azospirillum sp. TSO22-1 TaxID=716789 RepID=UPI000D60F3D0|nr:long-chain fatty acid--CoA ligase [Azospirillum sp. TSO22-1]PWC41726.1 AMP-dependent synthetase [Azospirillum sp. TSO22-1]
MNDAMQGHPVRPLPALSGRPMHSLLDEAVARFADRPCLDFLGTSYSYAEVGRLVDRVARGLQAIGVGKGTRVGLCLPNTPYSVIGYYGILKAGGIVVNYNPLYVERELRHQIEDSGTTVMLTLDERCLLGRVAAQLGASCLERVVVCPVAGIVSDGCTLFPSFTGAAVTPPSDDPHLIPFGRLIDNDGAPAPVDIDPAEDVAVLQYTGGTTGVPKGATLTHANVSVNAAQVTYWLAGPPGEDRVLGVLPLFHVFAMTAAMNLAIHSGAELILLPRFELEEVVKRIAVKRPTFFPAVPTIYTALIAAAQQPGCDLSSIRCCISGGAPLPLEVKERFEAVTGCTLVEGYGLSETSPVATCNPVRGVNKAGSIGVPLPGTMVEIRAVDDPRRTAGPGEHGEVCVRGPQVMRGYWNRPEETADIFVGDFLRTGDVGRVDEDGYVFLTDRIKDLILCGGYNVYPRVIEEALYQHPAVAECIVIGIPDGYRGQAPKAFVRLRDGTEATPEGLKDFLSGHLSRIEMPKAIELRAELPKTAVGKLSKKTLIDEERVRAAVGDGVAGKGKSGGTMAHGF